MAQDAGRDPASLPVTIGGTPDGLDKLKRFRDLGAARVNVSLMSDARDEILPILDKWVRYIHELRSLRRRPRLSETDAGLRDMVVSPAGLKSGRRRYPWSPR
jgi:hypothetical protein